MRVRIEKVDVLRWNKSTADYGGEEYDAEKKALIDQQHLRSNIPSLCIRNSLTNDAKCKLWVYKTSYE